MITWSNLWYRIILLIRVNSITPIRRYLAVRRRAKRILRIRQRPQPASSGLSQMQRLPVAYQHLQNTQQAQDYGYQLQRRGLLGAEEWHQLQQRGLIGSAIGQAGLASMLKGTYGSTTGGYYYSKGKSKGKN